MAIKETPLYGEGVALSECDGTWYVVTDGFHPNGADSVGYPSYRDAHTAWKASILVALNA